jgi:hypothetical protein
MMAVGQEEQTRADLAGTVPVSGQGSCPMARPVASYPIRPISRKLSPGAEYAQHLPAALCSAGAVRIWEQGHDILSGMGSYPFPKRTTSAQGNERSVGALHLSVQVEC